MCGKSVVGGGFVEGTVGDCDGGWEFGSHVVCVVCSCVSSNVNFSVLRNENVMGSGVDIVES